MAPPRHYYQLGGNLCYRGCPVHCRRFGSIPGLYKLDVTTTPTQLWLQIVTQKCPQTLLNVPWGAKSPPWRIIKLTAPLVQSFYNSKLLNPSLKASENPHSEPLSLGNMTRRHYVWIQKILGLKRGEGKQGFSTRICKGKAKRCLPNRDAFSFCKSIGKVSIKAQTPFYLLTFTGSHPLRTKNVFSLSCMKPTKQFSKTPATSSCSESLSNKVLCIQHPITFA